MLTGSRYTRRHDEHGHPHRNTRSHEPRRGCSRSPCCSWCTRRCTRSTSTRAPRPLGREDWLRSLVVAPAAAHGPDREPPLLPAVRRAGDLAHPAPLGPAAPRPVHARRAARCSRCSSNARRPRRVNRDPSITDVILNAQRRHRRAARPGRTRPRTEARAAGAALAAARYRGRAHRGAVDRLACRAVHADARASSRTSREPARALDWHWSSGAFAGFLRATCCWARCCAACCDRELLAAVPRVRAALAPRAHRVPRSAAGAHRSGGFCWRCRYLADESDAAREQSGAIACALLWAAPAFVFFSLAPFDFSAAHRIRLADPAAAHLAAECGRARAARNGLLLYRGGVAAARGAMPLRRVWPAC